MSHLASSCVCCIGKVVTFVSIWTSYSHSRRKNVLVVKDGSSVELVYHVCYGYGYVDCYHEGSSFLYNIIIIVFLECWILFAFVALFEEFKD